MLRSGHGVDGGEPGVSRTHAVALVPLQVIQECRHEGGGTVAHSSRLPVKPSRLLPSSEREIALRHLINRPPGMLN